MAWFKLKVAGLRDCAGGKDAIRAPSAMAFAMAGVLIAKVYLPWRQLRGQVGAVQIIAYFNGIKTP